MLNRNQVHALLDDTEDKRLVILVEYLDRIITSEQACKKLKVSRSTLSRYVKKLLEEGKLEDKRKLGLNAKYII